ncbi:MAG: hypothetical protein ACK451_16645, partial [Pseudanabaena sp.]
ELRSANFWVLCPKQSLHCYTYVIVEVKGDHEIDNPVVQAKKTFAEAIAGASKMTYRMLESSKANAGIHSMLFEDDLQAS